MSFISIDFGYLFLDSFIDFLLVAFHGWTTLPLLLVLIWILLKLFSGLNCWCLHYGRIFIIGHVRMCATNIGFVIRDHRLRCVLTIAMLVWNHSRIILLIGLSLHIHTIESQILGIKFKVLHPLQVLSLMVRIIFTIANILSFILIIIGSEIRFVLFISRYYRGSFPISMVLFPNYLLIGQVALWSIIKVFFKYEWRVGVLSVYCG